MRPPIGLAFNEITAPLDVDVENTVVTGKSGEASCYNILGLVSLGDASIQKAAENGGIATVKHADYRYLSYLFFYQRFTTVVYGD